MRALVIVAIIMLLGVPVAVSAQGQVPPSADNHLETFDAAIVTLQANYYSAGGKYLQYLRRQSGDSGSRCPNDQAACPEIPGAPDTPKLDYVVNVYSSPDGNGFECAGIYHANDETTYKRVINHGPETWREHDWQLIDASEVEN